jgi:tRNA(adenine34) deaminase
MQDPEVYMREAIGEAEIGLANGELPIGAVLVSGTEILARAHTMEIAEGRRLVHAELLALEAADQLGLAQRIRRESRLFTTCEPCLMCLGAAMSFGVGEIIFGHESPGDGAVELVQGWIRKEAAFPGYRVPIIQGGLLRDECVELFRRYVAEHQTGPMVDWARTIAGL